MTSPTRDDLMTIREMCDTHGVTPRTLRFYERFYERKELIAPLRRGSRRLHTRRDRARLTLILRGRRFGFSLEDIRQLLNLCDLGDGPATQLRRTCELALARLAGMERQRDELDQTIADLKDQIARGGRMLASTDRATSADPSAE